MPHETSPAGARHEYSEFKQCDPSCPGWEGLPSATPGRSPDEARKTAREVLTLARAFAVAIRTLQPVTLTATTDDGRHRTFLITATEVPNGNV